jgi:hypothetical protein
VHLGYAVWLEQFREKPEHAEDERADAVPIACRSMAALGRYKALLRMRYRDVDPWYWDHVHGLAGWMGAAGGGRTLIEPYPGGGYQTSVEREYLIALAYEAAPVANLLPAQLLALDLLLRRLATHFHFADAYRDTAPFVTAPGREPGVRRWLKGLKPRPEQRFFGVGGAYAQLAALRKKPMHEIPEWLQRARLDPRSYRALLDLLLTHWSTQPPQRRHQRERVNGEVLVSRGVAQVRRMIAASEFALTGGQLSYDEATPYDYRMFGKLRFGSVDQPAEQRPARAGEAPRPSSPLETLQRFELEGDRQMTERWTMTDRSSSGFGAIAPAHGGWARTGMLIAFRRFDSLDWHIAVVRRLNRNAEGKLNIGAQSIEGETLCARVRIGSGDAGNPWVAVAGTSDAYHDAILLRDGAQPRILLEPGMFSEARECTLSFEGVWHRARLERSLEQGFDYELVEVSLLAPDAAA